MLESQFKALYKCVDSVVKQRKGNNLDSLDVFFFFCFFFKKSKKPPVDLAAASGDFGEAMGSLSSSESNKPLSNAFSQLTKVQQKIKDLLNEQATQDDLVFGNTVDEYLRTMGSIKLVLQARGKSYAAVQAAGKSLVSKRETLEKTRLQPAKASKVGGLEKEVEEVKNTCSILLFIESMCAQAEEAEVKAKKDFEDISKLIREELAKFDDEKVADFQKAMQLFVESMMGTQKKVCFFLSLQSLNEQNVR